MNQIWDPATGTRRIGKKEVQERLIEAAVQSVAGTGLTVNFSHLNMEKLAVAADVPRASAYRAFEDRDELLARMMCALIKPKKNMVGAAFDPETLRKSTTVVEQHQHLLATLEGRQKVLAEAIRVGVEQNFTAIESSVQWKTYMALSVGIPTLGPKWREMVAAELRNVEGAFIVHMAEFYDQMLIPLGRRVRPGLSTQQIAAAGSAVVEGLVQRSFVNPDLVEDRVWRPGIDGDEAPWHLASIGFLAIVENMTEAMTDEEYLEAQASTTNQDPATPSSGE